MTNTERQNTLVVVQDWLKRNGLTTKSKRMAMLEVYRRTMQFHKGNVNTVKTLALPSEIKSSKQMFLIKNETPKIPNWYELSEKGKEVVQDLIDKKVWNEYLNALIFSNQMIDQVNTCDYSGISVTN